MANNILVAAIQAAFRFIVNLVRWVIDGVLNFVREVVNWFKKFQLNQKKNVPFIALMDKLESITGACFKSETTIKFPQTLGLLSPVISCQRNFWSRRSRRNTMAH